MGLLLALAVLVNSAKVEDGRIIEIIEDIMNIREINESNLDVNKIKYNQLPPEVNLPLERDTNLGIYQVDDGTGNYIYAIGYSGESA